MKHLSDLVAITVFITHLTLCPKPTVQTCHFEASKMLTPLCVDQVTKCVHKTQKADLKNLLSFLSELKGAALSLSDTVLHRRSHTSCILHIYCLFRLRLEVSCFKLFLLTHTQTSEKKGKSNRETGKR